MKTTDVLFKQLKKFTRRPIQMSIFFVLLSIAGIIAFFQTGAEIFFLIMIGLFTFNIFSKLKMHRRISNIEQLILQKPNQAIKEIDALLNDLERDYKHAGRRAEEGGTDHSKQRRLKKMWHLLDEIKYVIQNQS
ncbi:MAG: hypothetical protein K9L26_01735 [Candidatus Izimaplasma sp.]|nr:hypothetical protein [Candidatus Izimaplasma bacterium]